MVATFCLRLALGLTASLLVLSASQVPPRFFRVQYLTALALVAVAAFFLSELAGSGLWLLQGTCAVILFAGSVIWHLDGSPGQRLILLLANAGLLAMLLLAGQTIRQDRNEPWLTADDLASAAVLGGATSAMLMGHSYLIAPAMSLSPLYRLLGVLGGAVLVRIGLAALDLYWWTERRTPGNLDTELFVWLGVRWIVGLVGPMVLGWMAWEAARIRSTQSATGILYVVVILAFLGELTSLLLVERMVHPQIT